MKKTVWILILVFALTGCSNARFNEETMIHSKTHTRFDEDGYDFFGYNASGYDRNNFDSHGINLVTGTVYSKEGYDKDGYDVEGYDVSGYNREGIDRNGSYKGYRVKFETEGYAEGILAGKCHYKNFKVDGESTSFRRFMELRGSTHKVEYTVFHKNDFGTHINEAEVVKTIDLSKGHRDTLVITLSSGELLIN